MTGITGLRAHQQKLDVVANNLANMNTVGFKQQSTVFSDMLYQQLRSGSEGDANSGGINPKAIGSGVKVAQITRNFNQGALETTSQPFDYAMNGEGFFVLSSPVGGQDVYTRAGAFGVDSEGRLVDPGTGFLVQRIGDMGEGINGGLQFQTAGDDSIRVPIGETISGAVTELMQINGNLPANASEPIAGVISLSAPLEVGAVAATGADTLASLDISTVAYVPGDTIEFSGTNPDGTAFAGSVAADTATVQDLVDSINAAVTDATAALLADGTISLTSDNTGENLMSITLTDGVANTGLSNFGAVGFIETIEGYNGDSFELISEVVGPQGEAHELALLFTKDTPNTWTVTANIDPSVGTMVDDTVGSLTFNEDGSFNFAGGLGTDDANLVVLFNGSSVNQTVSMDLSSLSHYASAYNVNVDQDGIPAGVITTVNVTTRGELMGIASNGRIVPVAQLAVANFDNVRGLVAEGDNYYTRGLASGEPMVGSGETGGRGQIIGGQLEQSNVDIAQEFTQLIIAQRGFSANARTITVSDEVLEELTNIVR
ncbi:Flagellar hook protein FlgE [Stieleria bergensis]|uniref:Flagellar hook protein FlgE n=2 Tax=Stieleria bergensis TaxID=2528025 RepID=A0A517SU52_9BACT|nr:Flagellar hook protein FlgE [Planctomycetes bacterium SV_7m_r]